MSTRNAAAGYVALGKQTNSTTPVTPSVYAPYYSQSMATNPNTISDEPNYGNKFRRFQSLRGLRSHGGSLSVMAEPDSAPLWHDMVATKTGTSGSNPATHSFGQSTTDPNSYTVDISFVSYVVRFIGVQASQLGYGWDGEKMIFNLETAALGSFYGREVESIDTAEVTLKDTHGMWDGAPTRGLVVGDLVKVVAAADGTSTNFTVSSLTDTTVTLNATAASFAAGDMLVLRPASPSLATKMPFLWGRTRFFFDDTAADALTASATAANQTRLEPGTELNLMHPFSEDTGSKRSGSFDPASLDRGQYDLELSIKKFLNDPQEVRNWNAMTRRALVMRSYSEDSYELRVTLNSLVAVTNDTPTESGSVIYHEVTYSPEYSQPEGQAFDVKVISPRATV